MAFFLLSNGVPAGGELAETRVPWWSFGKTVLAATALSLVRDGLVGLDEQLPEGPFSLRQLLRHRAGLADYGELADYHAAVAAGDLPWTADEMLQRLDASRLRYAPGEGWRYSNVGYLYVARLIERVTGQALGSALAARALSPLGLERVRLAVMPADLQGVELGAVTGYHPGWVYHGLLVGTLTDAALFLERLLDGHLLPAELLAAMQEVQVLGGPLPGRPWMAPGYGLGLMRGPIANGTFLTGHGGCGPGSVVAVYRAATGSCTASCAVWHAGNDEGALEAEVVTRLTAALA